MTPLRYIVEPSALLMTWQPPDESPHSRLRRVVAEITPDDDLRNWRFRYLIGTVDVDEAKGLGFQGHPAFKLDRTVYTQGVKDTLLRRLPPRNREDFAAFLRMHRLPFPFPASDLALLGYTGAKLPSDGFAFVPVFPESSDPCEFVLEVAGVRHVFGGSLDQVKIGDAVQFIPEPGNAFDPNAVAVFVDGQKLGYVNRALLPSFHRWLAAGDLQASVERKNGQETRPLVFVRVRAGCPIGEA